MLSSNVACVLLGGWLLAGATLAPAQVIREFSLPQAGSSPEGITAGPDGNLWFTEFDGGRIGRITTAGVITEFPLPDPNSRPYGITAGADGNLWFVEFDGNRVGRITTAGVITEFSLPANRRPLAIASGADGQLWFTEYNGNRIGRITTNGVITEFSAGLTPGSGPVAITAGPDGNLWFSEYYNNRIGRVTTNGTITEFPYSAGNGWSDFIVTGPDGNLWFSNPEASLLTRFDPGTSAFTEFELPGFDFYPTAITAGSDGNLWFTALGNNALGRLSPTGGVSFINIPTPGSGPEQITAGPDGNIWFTEIAANKIGVLVLGGTLAVTGTNVMATEGLPFQGVVASFTDVVRPDTTNTYLPLPGEVPRPIVDFGRIASATYVAAFDRLISDVEVKADFTHTSVSDLKINLIVPGGSRIVLCNRRGGAATNFSNLVFDDQSPQSIYPGFTTYTNRFRPEGLLARMNGLIPLGYWDIEFVDQLSSNAGVLNNWSVTIKSYSPAVQAAGYQATIDWGDGHVSPGQVTPNAGGGFDINGTNTYTALGQFTVVVRLTNNSPPFISATITSSIQVVTAPLTITGRSLSRPPGVSFTNIMASFVDANPNSTLDNFEASIDWGDGSPASPGLITTNSVSGGFRVLGSHAYSSHGIYPLTLTILDSGNTVTTNIGSAMILTNINCFPIPTPGSAPQALATGPDGQLWFTQPGARQIGCLHAATFATAAFGTVLESNSMPAIVTGPDGNLWFTEFNQRKIGRITRDGAITEFATPNFMRPHSIAPGQDGRLWFTCRETNIIGQIDTNGGVNSFFFTNAASAADHIVAGPGGFLWFTENSGKIGRIDTLGNIVEFTVPTPGSVPSGLTVGPDTNLWFTEFGASQIGRMTPAGLFTEFPLPRANSFPRDIVAGVDGRLWFTEAGTNLLGCITLDGTVREIVLPVANPAAGLAAGPDGNIWFTVPEENKIGCVILDKPMAATGTNFTATAGFPFTGVVASFLDTGAGDWSDTIAALPPDVPRAVPDFSIRQFPLRVLDLPDDRVVGGVAVNLSVQHTYDSDLVLTLIAPGGTRVLLANQRGGSGHGYLGTTFDDWAPQPIGAGVAPFSGTFIPEVSLRALIGKPPAGTWNLEIHDKVFADSGTLLNWSLRLTTFSTNAQAAHYGAMINWGDGRVSPGAIAYRSNGLFSVVGTQTYASGGNFPVGIQINGLDQRFDLGDSTASATANASVNDALLLRGLLFNHSLFLYWPGYATNYVLQTSTNAGVPAGWADMPVTPLLIGDQRLIIESVASPNKFYRLRKLP